MGHTKVNINLTPLIFAVFAIAAALMESFAWAFLWVSIGIMFVIGGRE